MTLSSRIAYTLRQASIRQKLALIMAVTCAAGVLVAGGAVFAFQTYTLRSTFQRDLIALSDIVANNLSGPLAFADEKAALEVLASLKAKPQIEMATVRTKAGGLFVTLGASGLNQTTPLSTATARFEGWTLRITSPIRVEHESVGTLELAADFKATFLEALRLFLIVTACICSVALAVSLGIGYGLQGLITEPVLRLSTAARQIGENRDYGVRVEKLGSDELGILTDAFNGMLERLQTADAEMRRTNAALTSEIEERRRLQGELVEASRLAGMAEVATGVLHNVGNVLNSVNVSAGLMREQLHASRLVTLQRTTALLLAHEKDLVTFLTQDEKGRRVPGFLNRIADQLGAEHAQLGTELTGLCSNIEHIKEIVAMQQTYAKASAVIEQVDVCQLVNQAISIHRTSLERHRVQVVRTFPEALPAIPTDRHKILQVLTNFVANAIHAVKVNPPDQRKLSVTLRGQGDELALIVGDNGEGIPAENLPKIFRQGFTTRKEGHGFGLHSGVLIVKSLGGSLEVESPGPGLGATFTLRLPVNAAAIKHVV